MDQLKIPLNCFKNRYTINHPVLKDLPALLHLETECWPEPLRASPDEIRKRIEERPENHCVLDVDDRIVGVIFSQRIAGVDVLKKSTSSEAPTLYTPDGPVIQLLAVNVLPAMQYLGFGDQLLEFMLLFCALKSDVERVATVTLCKNYVHHTSMPIEAYIHARDEQGLLLDPILLFHEHHGASIKGIVPGYRPNDVNNRGCGVLVEYDIHHREPKRPYSRDPVDGVQTSIIEESIRLVLGDKRQRAFSPKRSLMDMGMDSLDLFSLRLLLGQRLGREIDPTFFFQYSTQEAITNFFEEDSRPPNAPWLPGARRHRTLGEDPPRVTVPAKQVSEAPDPTHDNAIAIVGMACRFPNGANSIDEYWRLLRDGVDAITEVPKSRWDIDRYYHSDKDKPGKIATRFGGFLDQVDRFDASFFNMSPREAAGVDPQQRILLESTWEALEHAGINPESLTGTRTGVFVGVFSHDYEILQIRQSRNGDPGAYFATGNTSSMTAGRVSYMFGLQGPAMAVDTACSSSLVAVHLACRSLRQGECDLAIAAGVNLLLSPELSVTFSRSGMLSPDGRCKTFDAAADGYARADGCGVVVLKDYARAVENRDNILAVVRGSAINQDGASNGLTAPNAMAQEAVIRMALSDAGVQPVEISYIETHGTGTSLGDPIEIKALEAIQGRRRSGENPLIIGSVKTNIGHTEAASGIAGLIKVVLSLQHDCIPPHLHFNKLNPLISLDTIPAEIPTRGVKWKRGRSGRGRLAGISSFGFSGTNAHVIVGDDPCSTDPRSFEAGRDPGPERDGASHILTLSAKNRKALKDLACRYEAHLGAHPGAPLPDLCFTTNTGRAHLHHRLALVADSVEELREALGAFGLGEDRPGVTCGPARSSRDKKIAFLFTGQGAQHPGMGRAFYETRSLFRGILHRCDEILRNHMEQPLLQILYPKPGQAFSLDDTTYTQPALFALEYALARLWISWGVAPDMVMGHSVGEYVAACIAGVFSLEDGLKLIANRGRLMGQLPRNGEMAAVFADEKTVARAIAPHDGKVSIAAFNGPDLIVISGLRVSVKAVRSFLKARDVKTTRLNVSHAFHSRLMKPMLDSFRQIAGEVSWSFPQIPLVSNVSGRIADAEVMTPEYWTDHALRPVKFHQSMETLHQKRCNIFLETGPRPVLTGMGRRCLEDPDVLWLASAHGDGSDGRRILKSLGELYVRGAAVDWTQFNENRQGRRILLPTYPFQRRRYWFDTDAPAGLTTGLPQGEKHKQLVRRLQASGDFSAEEIKLLPKLVKVLTERRKMRGAANSAQEMLWQVAWRPLDQGETWSPRDYMPSPREIVKRVKAANPTPRPGAPELTARLESIGITYILSAFRDMGWDFSDDSRFSTATAADRMGVVPGRQALLSDLLGMLSEEKVLGRTEHGWEVRRLPEIRNPESDRRALRVRHPDAEAELTILGRCGSNLAGVLRGERDPVQLLFPEADLSTAVMLYQDSLAFGWMNALMEGVVSAIAGRLPEGRKIRVLEIGAGTGGTTSRILPLLPADRTEYTFTDVSPLFTTRARERFREYGFVTYRALNIEAPPDAQGFKRHGQDVVIAANVLHATRDLRQTLRHARQMLAPGGLLALIEGTGRRRWIDLIFGLMEGWRRFSDHDLRPSHPLLTTSQWQNVLPETGFKETAMISPDDDEKGVLFPQAVILAQNGSDTAAENRTPEVSIRPGEKKHWLIFADPDGPGERLATRLRTGGDPCALVFPGKAFEQTGKETFRVNSARPGDFRRLLEAVFAGTLPFGVVYTWEPGQTAPGEMASEDLPDSLTSGCRGALHLIQALIAARFPKPPDLWLVTRGARLEFTASSETGPISTPALENGLAQSTTWGLGKVIAAEHPEFHCRLVDLDPFDDENLEAPLFDEIRDREQRAYEPFLAFRGGRRFAARLTRPRDLAMDHPPPEFRRDGTYLITGGAGGVGLRVSRWLVERGAGRLILVGRRDPSETAKETIAALEKAGARIVTAHADVSRIDELSGILRRTDDPAFRLRGVVHCAGVFDDRLLIDQSWPLFLKVFAPKVAGAWNLHRLTLKAPLDFFVLFSSAFSMFGESGMSNYVAANSFLDALAHYRRSLGLPGLSVNWGPWRGVGMAEAVGKKRIARWRAKGVETIPPDSALEILAQLMQGDVTQAGAAPVDGAAFPGLFPEMLRPTFLAELEAVGRPPVHEETGLLPRLEAASSDGRREILLAHICSLVTEILGFGLSEPLDPRRGFFELGLDSLTAMELRNRLQGTLRRPLSSTLTFRNPTMESLADDLIQEIFPPGRTGPSEAAGAQESPEPGALDPILSEVKRIPEEDLEASLSEELEAMENMLSQI